MKIKFRIKNRTLKIKTDKLEDKIANLEDKNREINYTQTSQTKETHDHHTG